MTPTALARTAARTAAATTLVTVGALLAVPAHAVLPEPGQVGAERRAPAPARPVAGAVRLRLAVQVPAEVATGQVVDVPGTLRGSFVVRGKRRAHRVVAQAWTGSMWRDTATTRLVKGGAFTLSLGRVDAPTSTRVVVRRDGRVVLASRPTLVLLRKAAPATPPVTPPRPPGPHLFVARLALPGGEVLTRTSAYAGEPTALDVDSDGTADLQGVLSVADGIASVRVSRLPGVGATLPVQVEGVLHRGPGVDLPHALVALGYDARDGAAPRAAELTLPLAGVAEATPVVALDVTQDVGPAAGARRFTVDLFDGTASDRSDETTLDLRTAQAPADLTGTATLAGSGPERVTLDGDAATVRYSGPAEDADVDLAVESSDEAAAGVEELSVSLSDAASDTLVTLDDAAVSGFRVEVEPRIAGLVASGSNAGDAAPTLPSVAPGGAALAVADSSFSLRAADLELVDVDPAAARLVVAAADSAALGVDVSIGGVGLTASTDELPPTLSVERAAAPADAGLTWESDGAPLETLEVGLTGAVAATGLDEVHLDLTDAPVTGTVSWSADPADGVAVVARNAASQLSPIGLLRMQGWRGSTAVPGLGSVSQSSLVVSRDLGGVAVGLQLVEVTSFGVDAVARTLSAQTAAASPLTVDLDGAEQDLDIVVDALPTSAALALDRASVAQGGGTRLTWTASAAANRVAVVATGAGLDPGQDDADSTVQADLRGVPAGVTVQVPDRGVSPQPPLAKVTVTGANVTGSGGPRVDELRLALGSGTLPASGGNDKLTFVYGGSTNVGVKLTNVKGLSFHPINTTIDQEDTLNGGTKPIDLNLSLPNESGPPATVTGQLNKPSFHTEMAVAVQPAGAGQPHRLTFVNGTAASPRSMASLSWRATGLGAIESATLGLRNLPRILQACLAADGSCRPTDRQPVALSNYNAYSGSPAQNATAGGLNRPYAAGASIDLNDLGTSGSSDALASMIEMDAVLDVVDASPITLSDVFFHRLALDVGEHPTNPTFSAFTTQVPRVYVFVDSANKPYVVNQMSYPPMVRRIRLGTDASPGRADRRLAWLPGGECGGAVVLGACVGTTVLDKRASGSHICGGESEVTLSLGVLGPVDVLDFPLVGSLLAACS
jgi:hypothetical protein